MKAPAKKAVAGKFRDYVRSIKKPPRKTWLDLLSKEALTELEAARDDQDRNQDARQVYDAALQWFGEEGDTRTVEALNGITVQTFRRFLNGK
ncbi:MAG: hypothetical protein QM811_06945 [Pirellulales bacterium]